MSEKLARYRTAIDDCATKADLATSKDFQEIWLLIGRSYRVLYETELRQAECGMVSRMSEKPPVP